MEAFANLFDRYVETFFVGFLTIIPIAIFFKDSVIKMLYEIIENVLEVDTDDSSKTKTGKPVKFSFVFITIFGLGLFFKSMTYWVFEDIHHKVIAFTENKYSPSSNENIKHKLTISDYLFFLPSEAIDFIDNKFPIDDDINCHIMDLYLQNLRKQEKWFIFDQDSHKNQVENIGRNITIAQGVIFSSIFLFILVTYRFINKLFLYLLNKFKNSSTYMQTSTQITIYGEKQKIKKRTLLIYYLFAMALYYISLKTWWGLEERYHSRIALSEQYIDKNIQYKNSNESNNKNADE